MAVGKAIYYLLSTNGTLSAALGTKIYPDTAPQRTAFPYIVFQEIATVPSDAKDGASKLDTVRVQVDIYDDNYDDVETYAAAARTALDRQTGTINTVTVDSIKFDAEESGGYSEDMNVWWRSQDYLVRLKR